MSHPAPTDLVLVRAQRGDAQALDTLLHTWSRPIRRWALASMGDAVRADDAAQDALLRIIAGLPSVDPQLPIGPWVRTVVRNVCIDHQRRRGRQDQRQAPLIDSSSGTPSTPARIDLQRGANRALHAIAQLTERQREVLLAVDHDGQTPSEVAELMGLAAGTVRATLFTARRALRTHLLASDPELAALIRETP